MISDGSLTMGGEKTRKWSDTVWHCTTQKYNSGKAAAMPWMNQDSSQSSAQRPTASPRHYHTVPALGFRFEMPPFSVACNSFLQSKTLCYIPTVLSCKSSRCDSTHEAPPSENGSLTTAYHALRAGLVCFRCSTFQKRGQNNNSDKAVFSATIIEPNASTVKITLILLPNNNSFASS